MNLEGYAALQISDAEGAAQTLYFDFRPANEAVFAGSADRLSPVSQSSTFDARFTGDCRISSGEKATIQLQATEYPLMVKMRNFSAPIPLPGEAAFTYVIKEMNGENLVALHPVTDRLAIEIHSPDVNRLILMKDTIIPFQFNVQQNYPNPFNPTTTIRYDIPSSEQVEIDIYNGVGQKINTLLSASQEAGSYEIIWDATDAGGSKVSSGVYFYRVQAGKHNEIRKMVLLR